MEPARKRAGSAAESVARSVRAFAPPRGPPPAKSSSRSSGRSRQGRGAGRQGATRSLSRLAARVSPPRGRDAGGGAGQLPTTRGVGARGQRPPITPDVKQCKQGRVSGRPAFSWRDVEDNTRDPPWRGKGNESGGALNCLSGVAQILFPRGSTHFHWPLGPLAPPPSLGGHNGA